MPKLPSLNLQQKKETLQILLKKNDKEVRPVKEIQEMEENIPGIGAQRRIVQWAFEEDVEVGDIKRFEVPERLCGCTGYCGKRERIKICRSCFFHCNPNPSKTEES